MAVPKLLNSGFGRTSTSDDSSTASRYTNLPQAVVVERIPITREASYNDTPLGRDYLATSSKETVVVERVRSLQRPPASKRTSPMGAAIVGVSLRKDVGASWFGSKPQSNSWHHYRHPVAGAVCHPSASEVARASSAPTRKTRRPTRSTEAATPYRLADPTRQGTTTSLADVPWQRGRVWHLHSSRVGAASQEAVVWKSIPASRRLTTSQDPRSLVRTSVADTQDKVDDRILDAVPRPHGNPRRTLQPEHHALPTPHETT